MGSIGRIAGIETLVPHVGESLVELLGGDIQRAAEIERVERLDVARNQHHVICRLIEHNKFAVAVVDQSAGGIDSLFQECVGVRPLLVLLVGKLQIEEAYDVYEGHNDNEAPYYIFSLFEIVVLSQGCPNLMKREKAAYE